MQLPTISVTVLTQYIHDVFVAEEMLHGISVCGEVSGIKTSGGHAYFVLKDANSQISCCCFRYAKTYLPKDGETVIIKGSVDFYSKRGTISLNADVITPYGKGLAALNLEKLKNRLAEEGYFDEDHKTEIPKYCNNVCVLTSAHGAVIRDIVKTVRLVNDIIDIRVCDVPVQGTQCADTIVKKLAKADKLGFDVIIIARGGGSAEDLMPFNDEKLVKAIYNATTPIISAVGHETDYTLCDLAADARAATPTAAAQMIAYDTDELMSDIFFAVRRMYSQIAAKQSNAALRLSNSGNKIASSVLLNCSELGRKLEQFSRNMSHLINNRLNNTENALKAAITRMSDVNPANILAKGYFALSKDGEKIVSVSDLKVGDVVTIEGHDGKAVAAVKEVK